MKDEFKNLVNQYNRYSLARISILLVLFFSFKSSIKNYNESEISDLVSDICEISLKLKSKPYSSDWLVNVMYLNKCESIYFNDHREDDAPFYTPDEKEHILSLVDTLNVDKKSLEGYQEEKVNLLEEKLENAFLVEIPIIKSLKVDLRFWLFYLPLLLILSETYLLSISRKIFLVVHVDFNENESSSNTLKEFPIYHNSFKNSALFFKLIEVFLLLIFVDTVSPFALGRNPSYILELLLLYGTSLFLVIAYHKFQKIRLLKTLNAPWNKLTIKLLSWYLNQLRWIKKLKGIRIARIGNILLISTLFLNMSQCNVMGENKYKGYEFFLGKAQWNLKGTMTIGSGFDYEFADKFMTLIYLLIILISVISMIYITFSRFKRATILHAFSASMIASIITIAIYFFWDYIPISRFLDWPFMSMLITTLFVLVWYRKTMTVSSTNISALLIKLSYITYLIPFWLISTYVISTYSIELTGVLTFWIGLHLSFLGYELMLTKKRLTNKKHVDK